MRTISMVLLWAACAGDNSATDADATDTVTDTPTSGDTGTEPGPPTSGDGWRQHEDFASIVYVSWEQAVAEDAHVEVSFDQGEWLSTPTKPATVGTNERIVMGVPYGVTAQWRVVTDSGTVDGPEPFLTGDPPMRLPLGTLQVSDDTKWYAEGTYFLTSATSQTGGWVGGQFWTFIIDRKGRAVWAQAAPMRHWTLYAQVALSGDHILWDEATYWSNIGNGEDSKIHRQYLDAGDPFQSYATPGLHHAFVQLPDGTLTWGSQVHDDTEALVELAPGATEVTIVWTCEDDWPNSGDCESNGIFYSPERDTYLYSFYTNNSIVEIDRKNGSSRWWAGEVPGGFSFDPPGSQVHWQHGISWTEAGTLLISTDDLPGYKATTTLLREYTVDEKTGVLTEVWSYDPNRLANTNGDALRLPNGNTMHVLGSGGQVREVTAKGELVWRVDFVDEARLRLLGKGEFISDLYALLSPEAP